ncbi:hypothetical protein QP173_02200 [Aerococcus urinae]|uniref:hypothetical protein n=1 Tax=Aerococcus TaxID=1375 RepID=UPI0018A715F3|nr:MULTISPECIES: hypothetical protein [Aerococcus]MCY3036184.1 hypothetical protein [Aerococcus sp. Group 2]MDK6520198.1 hypothetical protein [Aerococcus urinae]
MDRIGKDTLAFETSADKEREALLEELQSEISQSFAGLEEGRAYSLSEVRDQVKNYSLSPDNWL